MSEFLAARHECPGLRICTNHPRWMVIRVGNFWGVVGPGNYLSSDLYIQDTHAQALQRAHEEAAR